MVKRDYFHNILNAMNESVIVTDKAGIIKTVNDSVLRRLSYERDEIIGSSISMIIADCNPEDGDDKADWTRFMNTTTEVLFTTKEDCLVPVSLSVSEMNKESGEIKLVWVAQDIREKKIMKEALKASEEYARSFVESSQDCICNISVGGKLMNINPAGITALGLKRIEDVIGQDFASLINENRGAFISAKGKACDGNHVSVQYSTLSESEGDIWWDAMLSPVRDIDGYVKSLLLVARDISQARLSELKLKESEKRFNDIVSNSGDWIWEVDAEGRYTYSNRAVEDILGYSREEIIGRYFYEFFHPSERENLKKNAFETFSRKENFKGFMNRNIHKDGSTVYIETSGVPVIAQDGTLIGYRGADRDITERIRFQQQILEAQEILVKERDELDRMIKKVEMAHKEWKNTLDCVADMVVLIDSDGNIRRCNRAFSEFTGMSYQELIGQQWEKIIFENRFETMTFYVDSIELYHVPSRRWFSFNSYPYRDTDIEFRGAVITLHETTEIKTITKKLEQANRRIETDRRKLSGALEEISNLIAGATKQISHNIRFENPNLRKCYEVKKCTWQKCPCYGKEPIRCWQIAGTYCGGEIQGSFARKLDNCTECEVYKKATADPIFQIGEQFNNMMHVLEVKSRELTSAMQELKATQSQMLQREKMASIGQLAAGVAHEINNPMGFISSNLGTLQKYVDRLIEFVDAQSKALSMLEHGEVIENLNQLRRKLKLDFILEDIKSLIIESLDGADRVKRIVQNLKSFSRVDEAEYKLADINECIESTLNIVWNELKYKAKVIKEYGNIPLTRCYPQQLNQVFMNLLVNSAQAIEKQGEIRIRTWNGDDHIYISVEDTGEGIPQDKLNRIFEPFFTTKPVGKGTGLGLSITYDIIKKHNGDISVESETGKGTTFKIKIPVTESSRNV